MSVTPLTSAVLAELRTVLDTHEVAVWFTTANSSLDGVAPVEAVDSQPQAVLDAARADRFMLGG